MYPAHIFSLFPPFPREDTVFVAMSFDPRFSARWRDVISPAVQRIQVERRATIVEKKRLEPIRVDTRRISDSILTEIMSGIANSLLVFADITTIGRLDDTAIRNGNVMYEVGVAQAVRLPEEVVLFRSDNDPLLFDTSNIRVNSYSPDTDSENARQAVVSTLLDALKEINLRRHNAVKRAVDSLDYPSWSVLFDSIHQDVVSHPQMKTMGNVLANTARATAISRLLEMGALRTRYLSITPELLTKMDNMDATELLSYERTKFGEAILMEAADAFGFSSPKLRAELEKHFMSEPEK